MENHRESILGVQANSSNVLVAVRVRPLHQSELSAGQKSCISVIDGKIVAIKKNGEAGQYLKSQQTCVNEYEYDSVFDENSTQQEIYEKTAKSFIPKLINGQNLTVFAYGATGAGKTHTMLGDTRIDDSNKGKQANYLSHNGIIPYSVKDLFRLIQAKISKNMTQQAKALSNEKYSVFVTYVEVYNEQVYDLLEPSGKVLAVREDQERGIVVIAGVTEQEVKNYSEVIDLILQGNRQRKTESTMANALSSRSHAVLQLLVRKSTRNENGKEIITDSKLSLIDLAGSERASATNNRGIRLQEGANINKSLLALANCINALAENSNNVTASSNSTVVTASTSSTSTNGSRMKNVKFRDSKLTHLLKSSLEGNCHLIMIANINPSDQTYEDSHNTLKYANRAKNIKINPLVTQKEVKETSWIEREFQLRNENQELKSMVKELKEKISVLEEFRDYVLTFKRIPGMDEPLIQDLETSICSQSSNKKRRISNKSYDEIDISDISNEIQETVNQMLSFNKIAEEEEANNTSLSSLSTAQDLVCDLSSSNEQFSLNSQKAEEKHFDFQQISQEQIPEPHPVALPVLEAAFDSFEVNNVQNQVQPVQSVVVEEPEESKDVLLNSNLTNKRRRLTFSRRKSISVPKTVLENEEEEGAIVIPSDPVVPMSNIPSYSTPMEVIAPAPAPVTTAPIMDDDIMLTLEPPKQSEEPDPSKMSNLKKRRASNLPVPSMTIQTRAMRRQSLSAISSSLDTLTASFSTSTTTSASTTSAPVAAFVPTKEIKMVSSENIPVVHQESQQEKKISAPKKKVEHAQEVINTTTTILEESTSIHGDENALPTTANFVAKSSSSALTEKKAPLTPSNKGNRCSRLPQASNHQQISEIAKNPFATMTELYQKENQVNEFTTDYDDLQIDWLSSDVPMTKKSKPTSTNPVEKKTKDVYAAMDFSNINVNDENSILNKGNQNNNSNMPPPPSPTRRETRRMSISNRRMSMSKVNAMLDSVTSLLTVSQDASSSSNTRITTRSMR